VIEGLIARFNNLQKTFPANAQEANAHAKALREMAAVGAQFQQYPADYQKIVTAWAENCRQQQGWIAVREAIKASRAKKFDEKSFRVKAGLAVKAVLVIGAVAGAVVSVVLTAGATAPIFLGLAASGTALSGISSLGQLAKSINDNANTEKHILANVQKDVDAVLAAFNGAKGKGSALAKHVTELSNLMNVRKDRISSLQNEVLKGTAAAKSYATEIAKLANDPTVDAKAVSGKKKAAEELGAKLTALGANIKALEADNQEAQKVLDSLTALGASVDRLSGETAGSMSARIAKRLQTADGWLKLAGNVGGLATAASKAQF
jgi:hypothetical protein